MEPCIKCVYQRLSVTALALLFIIPAYFKSKPTRIFTYISSLLVILKSLTIAREHSLKQHNIDTTGSCGLSPNFPEWFRIDQWVPSIFEARGMCDQINWVFYKLTMPEWLTFCFLAILTLLTALIINEKKY
jgi:disulfide bond formation protein DsbB